jgi:hypothetical protein
MTRASSPAREARALPDTWLASRDNCYMSKGYRPLALDRAMSDQTGFNDVTFVPRTAA